MSTPAKAAKVEREAQPAPQVVPGAASLGLRAGGGQPLDTGARASMEQRFGHDFSRVRVHADGEAARSARALGAAAYAVGPQLVFGSGRYAPGTPEGDALLAHELAHTVQRERHPSAPATSAVSTPDAPAEREADRAAVRVARGRSAGPITAAPAAAVHRADDAISFFKHLGGQLGSLFGVDFTAKELDDYLAFIRQGRIEGEMDSDDKAVQLVREWRKGGSRFDLDGKDRAVLIWELLDGPTTGPDEECIVELLERSDNDMLEKIFGVNGDATMIQIAEDVPDGPDSPLANFCQRRWYGGVEAFRKSHGRPIPDGKAIPLGKNLPAPVEVPEKGVPDPDTKTYKDSGPRAIFNTPLGEAPVWTPELEKDIRSVAENNGAPPGLSFAGLVDFLVKNKDLRAMTPDAVLALQKNGLIPPGSIEKGMKLGLEEALKAGLEALLILAAGMEPPQPQPFPTGPYMTPYPKPTAIVPAIPIPIDSPKPVVSNNPTIRLRKGTYQSQFKPGSIVPFDFTLMSWMNGQATVDVVDADSGALVSSMDVEGTSGAATVKVPPTPGSYRLRIRSRNSAPQDTSSGESERFGVAK